ncbi:MAG TPA: aminopeptidase P family protein [Methanomassiliicoccales archaeon]|jgi:Xaa-Pro dipeptidase
MTERGKRIFSKLKEEIDAIVLINGDEPNLDMAFSYAAGTEAGLFEGCVTVVDPDGKVRMISSQLEETSARRSKAEVSVFQGAEDRSNRMKDSFGHAKKIGINGNGLTYANYMDIKNAAPKAEIVDVSYAIAASRLVKDQDEIGRLRKACQIASRIGEELPSIVKEGMPEFEAAAEVGYRMMKLGASATSFTTNASWGPNSAEPHHEPDDSRLKKGDTVLFDYGALYNKYGSDVTRTFVFGKAEDWQKEIYDIVLQSQLEAIDAVHAGARAKDVDAVARRIIDSTRYKGRFIHSLGHGIGLSVHDGGRFSPTSEIILEENMVMTVEPGIYLPGKGGVRIEDDIRVTKNGCEVLTTAKKEFMVI